MNRPFCWSRQDRQWTFIWFDLINWLNLSLLNNIIWWWRKNTGKKRSEHADIIANENKRRAREPDQHGWRTTTGKMHLKTKLSFYFSSLLNKLNRLHFNWFPNKRKTFSKLKNEHTLAQFVSNQSDGNCPQVDCRYLSTASGSWV